MMKRILLVVGLALVGCGSTKKALLPVDSPLRPWVAPDMPQAPESPPPPQEG